MNIVYLFLLYNQLEDTCGAEFEPEGVTYFSYMPK